MTRYGTGRHAAKTLAFFGWACAGASVLLLVAGVLRLANPLLVALNIPTLFVGIALGLVLVVGSHLARAMFDVADTSTARSGSSA